MWLWYGYWRPWGWGWPGYWGAIPYGWPWAPMPKEQEIAMLEDEARWLERDLDSIRKRLEELRTKEKSAFEVCRQKVEVHGLPMKIVDVEYQFDGNKITFYFTSEQRVDFRQLVKDLAASFKTRIELRQIGARDEAKRFPGYGVCGKKTCCTSWLWEFEPVSLRMASRAQRRHGS